jgi:type VI secretion system protein ImpA
MLDLDALLAPIDDASPTGVDLSFSTDFDRILESRRADDPTLDQGEWQADIKYADWSAVLKKSDSLLRTRSKDLRLAGWLAEAAAQIDGVPGLTDGYRVIAGLCERYWDVLHPAAIDGDQEERIGNLSWLLSNSLQWLRTTPIVSSPQGRFTLLDFETAHARGNAEPEYGQPTLDQLDAARRDTPADFYRRLLEAIPECGRALSELQAAVDARLGIDGPSFSAVRELIEHLQRIVQRSARDSGLLLDGQTQTGTYDSSAASDAIPNAPGGRGANAPPTTRRDALAQLRLVAEFFRRTEPHSPVAYLAEKAASWGEMPLHVWLKRVIKDDSVLQQIEEMLDVNQNNDGK